MEELPVDIKSEILVRHPTKSLLQFKSVSEPWNALISNGQFAKLHLDRTPEDLRSYQKITFSWLSSGNGVNKLLLEGSKKDTIATSCSRDFPIKAPGWIQGSCDGLLCINIFKKKRENIVLWNPSTGEYNMLPTHKNELLPNPRRTYIGFGYNSTADDYKVLKVYQDPCIGTISLHVDMYSVKSNSWKSLSDVPPRYTYLLSDLSVAVDGSLYWIGERSDILDGLIAHTIIAFDLEEEKFRELPMPQNSDIALNITHSDHIGLVVFGGRCLGLLTCYVARENLQKKYKLWVKEEGSNEFAVVYTGGEDPHLTLPIHTAMTYFESLISPNHNGKGKSTSPLAKGVFKQGYGIS